MNRTLKKVLIAVGALLGLLAVGIGIFVGFHVFRYSSSMDKVYAVPLPKLTRSTDAAVLERGKHLAEAIAPCAFSDCHGSDLSGGKPLVMGPLGTLTGPNISAAGLGAAYSDGELARLIRHGLKRDGRSVQFMPSHEFSWMSDADIAAIVSYLRSLPPVQKPNGPMEIGVLAKILDRYDMVVIDVARRVNHDRIELAPPPAPSADYGRFLAKLCTGCHGDKLSGGPIPGAPPELPIPSNLTPDATGLKGWSYEDFDRLLTVGMRKNKKKLDPFMPIAAYSKWDETEKKALWAHLSGLPPLAFGGR